MLDIFSWNLLKHEKKNDEVYRKQRLQTVNTALFCVSSMEIEAPYTNFKSEDTASAVKEAFTRINLQLISLDLSLKPQLTEKCNKIDDKITTKNWHHLHTKLEPQILI